jgi:5-methyltetrahydrofolate--homocysteine methyltransferase
MDSAAYIAAYSGQSAEAATPETSGQPADIRKRLGLAVIAGDVEVVTSLVDAALSEGLTPMEISNEGLLPGLEEVGRRFEKNQLFLPQVMRSAETMQTAFTRLKAELNGLGMQPLAKILMATVEGDIHDIGKNIVCTLLENHGFEVIDLGKNVSADRIVAAAQSGNVDAVGLSALMTTTMSEMENVVGKLKASGVKTFTMVGGAVVTQEYAESIGADLYARDAMDAVARIKKLLKK